ncbi:unnamed protein product [Chondrus crispus]|uniref:Uncharacterized protein n=1 Tax=Chondrus crispus TaxID=2769 RepID=R7QFF5_CHOCR|nr:unnamed protein product [Chondrus crispus]CDF36150.1 unnamed protein product [Chondrus crispus]|eukprot:XP_005715969.1 unnamed protein product [Chondrus crispus]
MQLQTKEACASGEYQGAGHDLLEDSRSALVGRCGSAQASSNEACRVWRLAQSEPASGSCPLCEGISSLNAEYDKSPITHNKYGTRVL